MDTFPKMIDLKAFFEFRFISIILFITISSLLSVWETNIIMCDKTWSINQLWQFSSHISIKASSCWSPENKILHCDLISCQSTVYNEAAAFLFNYHKRSLQSSISSVWYVNETRTSRGVGLLRKVLLSCVILSYVAVREMLHWYWCCDWKWLLWYCGVGLSEKVRLKLWNLLGANGNVKSSCRH